MVWVRCLGTRISWKVVQSCNLYGNQRDMVTWGWGWCSRNIKQLMCHPSATCKRWISVKIYDPGARESFFHGPVNFPLFKCLSYQHCIDQVFKTSSHAISSKPHNTHRTCHGINIIVLNIQDWELFPIARCTELLFRSSRDGLTILAATQDLGPLLLQTDIHQSG